MTRNRWTTVKTITSYTGKSRFLTDDTTRETGRWAVNPAHIPSPYSYSPTRYVYSYRGRHVVLMETSHKRYEVIALPADVQTYASDDLATAAFLAPRT